MAIFKDLLPPGRMSDIDAKYITLLLIRRCEGRCLKYSKCATLMFNNVVVCATLNKIISLKSSLLEIMEGNLV